MYKPLEKLVGFFGGRRVPRRAILGWAKRDFAPPSPRLVKRVRLRSNGIPGATWVETGTHMGDTTDFLAAAAPMVYSIEPEPTLYERAVKRFAGRENIKILHGTSETIFPDLLPRIDGDVNFWLDGHYSGDATFQGDRDTPIIQELAAIDANIGHFGKLAVMIDDIRMFDGGAYPSVDELVDWARQNALVWHIEHDMFIARRT